MSGVYDDTACQLGEGPLWHPERGQLYWFDILGRRLHTREAGRTKTWQFDALASAAGWVDGHRLLIASERELFVFDMGTGASEPLCDLEAGNLVTRANDGRADPWGGFWIGTMGKAAEARAGAIYRWYQGELRRLYQPITISNAICFTPDRSFAYFTDTPTRIVMRQALDPATGWPKGEPFEWLDLRGEGLNPDGAVVDAEGNFWCAQWGASRVACYDADARFLGSVAFPARHTSCPAFGGDDLTTLFCTSAQQGLDPATLEAEPENGMTLVEPDAGRGQAEHRVIL